MYFYIFKFGILNTLNLEWLESLFSFIFSFFFNSKTN